jgi:hypothetical protein
MGLERKIEEKEDALLILRGWMGLERIIEEKEDAEAGWASRG